MGLTAVSDTKTPIALISLVREITGQEKGLKKGDSHVKSVAMWSWLWFYMWISLSIHRLVMVDSGVDVMKNHHMKHFMIAGVIVHGNIYPG